MHNDFLLSESKNNSFYSIHFQTTNRNKFETNSKQIRNKNTDKAGQNIGFYPRLFLDWYWFWLDNCAKSRDILLLNCKNPYPLLMRKPLKHQKQKRKVINLSYYWLSGWRGVKGKNKKPFTLKQLQWTSISARWREWRGWRVVFENKKMSLYTLHLFHFVNKITIDKHNMLVKGE